MTILRRLRSPSTHLHREQGGQTAIAFVLTLLFVFVLFALAFDAGVWFFDHRTAQNQAEAAALAAVQQLPATDTTAATTAADEALIANGSDASERSCLEFEDRNGDGRYETARVCVQHNSPGVFSNLSGVTFVKISAAATAMVGPVDIANVMPWGVVPPDGSCDAIGETCQNDLDGDGTLEACGAYLDCPWGLSLDKLYAFKVSGTITPGNFGVIAACGKGTVNYRDCINGETVSGFYEEGETIKVETQTGNLGQNTHSALTDRYPASTWAACDVAATPESVTGLDPDGHADAVDRYVDDPVPGCEQRLVMVPIINEFPQGSSGDITVLGVGVFAIVSWDRNASWGNAEGTTADECGAAAGGGYECGMVWGYFMQDARPPDFLLERIGDSDNPFAPLLIALVE